MGKTERESRLPEAVASQFHQVRHETQVALAKLQCDRVEMEIRGQLALTALQTPRFEIKMLGMQLSFYPDRDDRKHILEAFDNPFGEFKS